MSANYTPYSKTCSAGSRKFYNDFDLLPPKYREMLREGVLCPDFDDLKAAWELAGTDGDITDIRKYLYSFQEEVKAEKIATAKAKREAMKEERRKNRLEKWKTNYYMRPVYRTRMMDRGDGHDNLVARVMSMEEAAKALKNRKENKDVKPILPRFYEQKQLIGYEKVTKPEPEVKYQENLKPDHIAKAWHNA